MFVIELSLKLSPMPARPAEGASRQDLYNQIRQAMESAPHCSSEKEESKRISLLTSEVVAVQTYEKSSLGGGSKRPGFSFDG